MEIQTTLHQAEEDVDQEEYDSEAEQMWEEDEYEVAKEWERRLGLEEDDYNMDDYYRGEEEDGTDGFFEQQSTLLGVGPDMDDYLLSIELYG
jgi:hypothetical protein